MRAKPEVPVERCRYRLRLQLTALALDTKQSQSAAVKFRRAGLVLVYPDGDQAPLTSLPDGGFRIGDDPVSPERVEFTTLVEGRPMRAVVSGWPFDRLD